MQSKGRQGFTVHLKTENDWGGGKGDRASEKIRTWLKQNYLDLNLHYLLIIGNPDSQKSAVPMKMLWPRNNATIATKIKKVPSDIYYSDLKQALY